MWLLQLFSKVDLITAQEKDSGSVMEWTVEGEELCAFALAVSF
jgi:hypothetical protein